MALTDLFIRRLTSTNPNGEKHTDGGGQHLLVRDSGKYWRMDYRFVGKRKTLSLGIYLAVTLASARKRRDQARTLIAEGIDLSQAKQDDRREKILAASQTFKVVAEQWLKKIAPTRLASMQEKVQGWLKNNVFPAISKRPIADLKPRDILLVVQKMEARGLVESAHRVNQVCGQIFRFTVATGLMERDITADLRGALAPSVKGNFAVITDPKQVDLLLRSIDNYNGYPAAVAAIKLAPMFFVRPGDCGPPSGRNLI